MLRNLAKYVFTSIILFVISFSCHATEKFILDDQHTYVFWHINHLGFSNQVGKWYAKGFLTLDKEQPQNSKVEATIDISSMSTGLPELDKHLKSSSFFDVEKYPTATFVSNKVEVLSKNSAKVFGTLTLHGVSKPVTLMVKLNKVGKNPLTDKTTAGFSAKANIKRSEFGMNTLLPSLGDEVTLEIGAEAYQNSSENQNADKK